MRHEMENHQISLHEMQIWVRGLSREWRDNAEIAHRAGVARRTARHHTKRLVDLGLVERTKVFPGFRFRIADNASNNNPDYFLRLERAQGALRTNEEAA